MKGKGDWECLNEDEPPILLVFKKGPKYAGCDSGIVEWEKDQKGEANEGERKEQRDFGMLGFKRSYGQEITRDILTLSLSLENASPGPEIQIEG